MKKYFLVFIMLMVMFGLSACGSNENTDKNPQILAIYNLAVDAGFDGTYDEWLETIEGAPGVDGKEVVLSVNETHVQWKYEDGSDWNDLIAISELTGSSGVDGESVELRYNEDYIQWKNTSDTVWNNLIETSMLMGTQGLNGEDGSDGVDGEQVQFQMNENTIQWKYLSDTTWTNLYTISSHNKYFLTDEEINSLLDSYYIDMQEIIPEMNLNNFDIEYTNDCTTDFDFCNNISNYPNIFGEGYEKYMSKQDSVDLLATVMSLISNLMGDYESEPIVPTEHLSGTEAFATVTGRNTTSILFEGELTGDIPIPVEIPFEGGFGFQLLMYKSVEDGKIYLEGIINLEAGAFGFSVDAFSTSFVSTYDFDSNLENVVYTTDVIGLSEWVSVLLPNENGLEIFSSNQEAIEYFNIEGNNMDILYSEDWYVENVEYVYEKYTSDKMEYTLEKVDSTLNYYMPLDYVSGWDVVEVNNDTPLIGSNEYSYYFTLNNIVIQTDTVGEDDLLNEDVWVIGKDYKYYYIDDNLESMNAKDTVVIRFTSKDDLETFLSNGLVNSSSSTFEEYIIAEEEVSNFTFLNFDHTLNNFEELFAKFNLRD